MNFGDKQRLVLMMAAIACAACNPNSTRPQLTPLPEAQTNEAFASPAKSLDMLAHALQEDSIPVRRIEIQDTWLDSGWFVVATQEVATGMFFGTHVVRVRAWTDVSRPKYSQMTVEAVYRTAVDPSEPPRELERPLPKDHPVMLRIKKILETLGERKGLRDAGKV